MSSLGNCLRELRKAKGASLDDIARSTRVGRGHLEALESDSLRDLPAPVFVKGFIRAYCEFLDASPDEALGLYRQVTGEPLRPEHVQGRISPPASRRTGPLILSLVLFIALGVSLFALRLGLRSSPPQMPAVSAPAGAADSGPAPAPDAAKAAPAIAAGSAPPQAAEAQPGGQRLVIRAVEPTWIRVQVDEGQVTEELLQAGAVREWTAARRFVLTVGNAGGLEVDLNGRKIPPLGAKGAVIQRLVLPQEAPGTGS